ncbi:epoxide hydrolase family protein [Bacillus infantis]|uniref:epoxide hydrolase family protein n=1 Tax=Bacillus infantis TaxID=324767 RepID=UPI002005AD6E
MEIKPKTIRISKEEVEDLKSRLKLTRFPDEIPNAEWEYGIPLDLMKDIMRYWENEFNWYEVEKRINSFSNYQVNIDGIDIHFIHERGSGLNSIPIIIPHGWPGSFYEMLDIIPYLTTPEKFGGNPNISFDVVIPSIPGHGFSDIPLKKGFEDRQVANLL